MNWAFATFEGDQNTFFAKFLNSRYVEATREDSNIPSAKAFQAPCVSTGVTAALCLCYMIEQLSVVEDKWLCTVRKHGLKENINVLHEDNQSI